MEELIMFNNFGGNNLTWVLVLLLLKVLGVF